MLSKSFYRTFIYRDVTRYCTCVSWRKDFSIKTIGKPVPVHDAVASDAFGRLYEVYPNNAEFFFPSMPLRTMPEPTSFTDVKTINGAACHTYK
ncbi:hypothetical protein AVEN_239494-1 [Araneus ventricosus]|uniref:Uncharacterized protein n=1 Tax=Araneus ventricosus TaxID=182803 RepID=A0A4Y2IJM8_ARAVE|nr:hypothetical protein AVEN_239494-1 [Araneus ventricosus]